MINFQYGLVASKFSRTFGDPDFRPWYQSLVLCQVHKTARSIFWRSFGTILPSVSAFDDLSSLSYYLDLPFDVRRVSHTQPMWPRLSRHPQSRPGCGHSGMSKATEVSSLLHRRFISSCPMQRHGPHHVWLADTAL